MHTNLKVLLINASIIYAVQALSSATSIALKQFRVWLAVNGCVSRNPLWLCLILRASRFGSSVGFAFIHLVIFIERSVATYSAGKYEKFGVRLGVALALLLWLLIASWTCWAFIDEITHPQGYVSDCMMSMATTLKMADSMYYCLAIDVAVLVGDFALFLVNRRQRNRYVGDYSLRKSYQMKENHLTMQVIFPCSVVHTSVYAVFLFTNGLLYSLFARALTPLTGTIMEATQWLFSAYLWTSLVCFYWIRQRVVSKSFVTNDQQPVDQYFNEFDKHIAYRESQTKRSTERQSQNLSTNTVIIVNHR